MDKQMGKVVNFPNRIEKMFEKAHAALGTGDYQTAAQLYLELLNEHQTNADALLGLMTALYEVGELENARIIFEEYAKVNTVEDFHILQLYLTILFDQKDYQAIVLTIERLKFKREIPEEYQVHFNHLLSVAEKVLQVKADTETNTEDEEKGFVDSGKVIAALEGNDTRLQKEVIFDLADMDSTPFLPSIKKFLRNPNNHPILKTLLLTKLIEEKIDDQFEVEKFDRRILFNPATSVFPGDTRFVVEISKRIQDYYAHTHPSIVREALEMIKVHGSLFFPIEPFDLDKWGEAYQFFLNRAFSINEEIKIDPLIQEKMNIIQRMEQLPNPFA